MLIVLDLGKQKGFYTYEYMNDFKSLKKNCLAKKVYISLKGKKKIVIKNINMFLVFKTNLKWK